MKRYAKWNTFYIINAIISLVCLLINYRISIGIWFGMLLSFIVLKFIAVKFPSLNGSFAKVGTKWFLLLLLQGAIMAVVVLTAYLVAGLPAFLALFAVMIFYNIWVYLVYTIGEGKL